ncbi:MAG: ATP-dependent Clp protease proteolytic subunit [Parcubacteria group bacterium]|nr:ATP-dependent Clp protease proteolytic subunit [Parcubacteria group bacterium]
MSRPPSRKTTKKVGELPALELTSLIHALVADEVKGSFEDIWRRVHLPLLLKRQVLLFGVIDEDTSERVIESLLLLEAGSDLPITLYVHSHGGDIDASLEICAAIQHLEAPVDAIVVGKAQSSAFHILQACRKRNAYSCATFMLHGPRFVNLRTDAPGFNRNVRQMRRDFESILQMIADRSRLSLEEIRAFSREEATFTAAEALRHGFIDTIIR